MAGLLEQAWAWQKEHAPSAKNAGSMVGGVLDAYAQEQLPQGLLIPGNPYSYYSPSPVASFANAFAKGFSGAQQKSRENADRKRRQEMQDTMLNMQQQQAVDQQRSRQAAGMLATGMLGGDVGAFGRTPVELNSKYGFNPMEYVDPKDVAAMEKQQPMPVKIGQGDGLYDPRTGSWMVTPQDKQTTPVRLGANEGLWNPATNSWDVKPTQAPDRARISYMDMVGPEGPGKYMVDSDTGRAKKVGDLAERGVNTFDQEKKLRDTFNSNAKEFVKIRDAYGTVEANKGGSAASDIGLIFSIMKMFDPGSVVREGEFATAQNAGGVDDRIRAQYNRILSGERLSESQRNDFVNTAKNTYTMRERQLQYLEEQTAGLAEAYGLDPKKIITDYRYKGLGQDQPSGNTQSAGPKPDPLGIRQ